MNPQQFIEAFFAWSKQEHGLTVFNKNQYLSEEGDTNAPLYFIHSGAVRAIYVSANEEFTIRFGYANSIIASLDSFLDNQPSKFFIQALRKTAVYSIPRDAYFEFVHSTPELTALHARFMETIVVSMLDREIDLLTSSPMERYQRLMERSPQVFQHIPLKYIAAYLRMTPETLSRLRNLDLNQD
jgi:CRP-like cAMP-binding protein